MLHLVAEKEAGAMPPLAGGVIIPNELNPDLAVIYRVPVEEQRLQA